LKYRVIVQSSLSQKGNKPDRFLEVGDTVDDLTPAQVKGLKANNAIEPASKRARTDDGQFVADDPTTAADEAWEDD
jgi:hypothetical protein